METVRFYDFDQIKEFQKKEKIPQIDEKTKELLRQNKSYQYNAEMTNDEELNAINIIVQDLKETNESFIRFILSQRDVQLRWNPDYFPFTEPSFELEAQFNGKWVEMMGSGKIIRSHS